MRMKQSLHVFPMGVYTLLEPEESGSPFNYLVYDVEQINLELFLCVQDTGMDVGTLLGDLLADGAPLPVEPLYSVTS